ncbi:ficolin-1-like [Physella acuta]|uniref:ficolin-1-like n=1 Tax=Physella acuta TaxID=109671 RepID=UPI0027DD1FEC|nr:ficolin-1-like [Physella acuta]
MASILFSLGSWLFPLKDSQQKVQAKIFTSGKFSNTTRHITVLSDGSISKQELFICTGVNNSDPRHLLTLTSGLQVMCDTMTDGGEWTIFQRRVSGAVDFYRNWTEYKNGFGDFTSGNFYLGNENMYLLTSKNRIELRGRYASGLAAHKGMMFSTFDRDNDKYSGFNCANYFHGAWWFKSCHNSHLNAGWGTNNLYWMRMYNTSLNEMKFRAV